MSVSGTIKVTITAAIFPELINVTEEYIGLLLIRKGRLAESLSRFAQPAAATDVAFVLLPVFSLIQISAIQNVGNSFLFPNRLFPLFPQISF